MKKGYLTCMAAFILVTLNFELHAQSAGDIMFTAFDADTDRFAVVVLSNLSNTSIYFRDDEWDGTSAFNTGEGILRWDITDTIWAGQVIVFSDLTTSSPSVSYGTVTKVSGSIDLETEDEGLYAYTGTDENSPTTFLSAIFNDFSNRGGNSISNTSLTANSHVIELVGDDDVGQYDKRRSLSEFSDFLSTSYLTGNLRWSTADGSGTQSLTIDTRPFISSRQLVIDGDAGWRMIGLPLDGADLNDISDDTAIQGVSGGSNPGSQSNVYTFDISSQSFTVPGSMSSSFNNGEGLLLYFFDNTSNGSSELPVALDLTGTQNTSSFSVSIERDKFALLANPFNRDLDTSGLIGNGSKGFSGLVATIQVWDDAAGSPSAGSAASTTGSYVSYNFGTGNHKIISTWQGFFVESFDLTVNSANSVQFSVNQTVNRADFSSDVRHFSKSVTSVGREIGLNLKHEAGYADVSTRIYLHAQSSPQKDLYDASKLAPLNGSPNIAFQAPYDAETALVQDSRALDPEDTQWFHILFNDQGISGNYTLDWSDMKHIPDDWILTFYDVETGIEVDMMEAESYTFTVDRPKQKRVVNTLLAPRLGLKQKVLDDVRFRISLTPAQNVSSENTQQPVNFSLAQNYPNPFNPTTRISYRLNNAGRISLKVYNMIGQEVAVLVDGFRAAGEYQAEFDATGLPSGVYLYELQAGANSEVKKMTLLK